MPQVYNGCGTWYYGKKNLSQYAGTCRACNRQATLTSYDTRLYVVVVFIPVIPLQRKRILDECSACRRHYAMPLAEWNRAHRRAQDSMAAYRAAPADAELAKEALRGAVGFRNLPLFLELAPEIERGMAADANTLCMLAGAHEVFARFDESERILRQAVTLKPDDDDVREAYADCLMSLGRPDEAEPYLRHIVDKGVPDRIDPLYRLAQGYQIKGRHDKALEVFAQCERVNPHITDDATFVRLKEASEKNLGKAVVVKPGDIVRKAKARDARRKVMKLAPIVLAVLVIAYVALAWLMGTQTAVFLVNGVGTPYTVKLNGAAYPLAAHEVKKIRLGQRDVRVEVEGAPFAPETVAIHTPFLTRPFASHTTVINPDRGAILQHRSIIYAAPGSGGHAPEPDYAAGRVLHRFDGIDYEFEAPPSKLDVGSKGSLQKEMLSTFDEREVSAPVLLAVSREKLGDAAVRDAAKAHLLTDPDQADYLFPLAAATGHAEYTEFLRTGLSARPIRMQWHRAYQQAMDTAGNADRCAQEYAAMLAADPDNRDLMYLAARQMHDPDKSVALLERAAAGDAPSAYALYSLCGYYVDTGDLDRATDYARRVLKFLPNEQDVRYYAKLAFLANGQYEAAASLNQADEAGKLPGCLQAYSGGVVTRAMQGRADLAEEVIRRMRSRFSRDPSFVQDQDAHLHAHLAYCTGDAARFVAAMRGSPEPGDRLAGALTDGDIDAAEKETAPAHEPDAYHDILIYLVAAGKGRTDVADKHLHAAIDLLAKGDNEDRIYAAALSGKSTLPVADLVRLRDIPFRKATMLAAVGTADRSARDACFAMARRLNYSRDFPHLIIRSATEPSVR